MNKTIIDYLSFSGSPLLLERCKEMAKQRFTLSQAPNVFESQTAVAVANRENTKIRYFAENLAQVLGCNEMENFANRDLYYASLDKKLVECDMEIATDCTFNECYQQLISNIGIDMLDVLCHFEVESFVELLNEEITYKDNHWTLERRGGFSGYSHSALLLCNGSQAGLVAWGAANFGFYVSFSGSGCSAIKMDVLHKALKQMPYVKLTRVDVAYDDLQGAITVPYLREQYENGEFITRGAPPGYSYFESGSLVTRDESKKYGVVPDKGRTLYVGQRQNGKLFRGYEKGKQMKSIEYPDWVRLEVQIGNKSRVIPLDILIDSDAYFTGAYPALASVLENVEPKRIPIARVIANAQIHRYTEIAKKQYGKFINFLNLMHQDSEHVIKLMTDGFLITDIPDRLKIPLWSDSIGDI
ncbi:replication initiation factor domain-containing protein [Vibrio anguillarum]|uniref:replication initiation factor domain-containing protein n=1 Tax=Vibrio anguillarum TaxID=55601 RepID=UPI000F019BE6|nr:replication initiation factor domain-containing protein [Vibrio anguillarum]RMZ65987.1 replication protein [Vibrio anguillarum]